MQKRGTGWNLFRRIIRREKRRGKTNPESVKEKHEEKNVSDLPVATRFYIIFASVTFRHNRCPSPKAYPSAAEDDKQNH